MCWRFYNLINMPSTHAQNNCLPSCTRNPVQGVNLANSCQFDREIVVEPNQTALSHLTIEAILRRYGWAFV